MKANKFFAVLLIGLAVAACNSKPSGENLPKEFQPSRSQIDSVSYLLGINFGSFIKGYNFGTDLNWKEIEKGMKEFVFAEGNTMDPSFVNQFKINPNEMNALFNAFVEKRITGLAQANKAAAEKFFESNGKKDGVVTSGSGLQYRIINPGTDVKPGPKDTVWVLYKGSLLDGTVFDETPEGSEPVRLMLNRVIPGWTEGLQLIGEGGEIDLFVPSDLGYGPEGNQAIGPNSALIFNVKVDRVGKYVEPAPAEEKK